jgi:hypothetical protein
VVLYFVVANVGSLEYLHSGIDVLEPFLGEAHKAIKEEAGWVGLTITGGPNPRLNGGLSYKM